MTIKKVVAGMVFVAAAFLSGCSNALGGNMENSGTADITVACRGTDIGSGAGYTVTVTLFDASDNSVVGTSAGTFSDGTGTLNCSFEKIKYGTAVYASVIESISVIVDTNVTVDIVAAGRSGIVPVKAKTVLDIALKKFNPSTTFFVAGTNPLLITSAGNDDNSGTFNAPFATLGKALNAVNTANDGSSSYTIFVDGTVTEAQPAASTQDAPSSCASLTVSKTMNLTVTSLCGSATVQAPGITTAQNAAALLYISLSSTASDGVSLSLTLKDISIICPSAEKIESGKGIFYSLASSSSLTLDGCSVVSTADMVIPVYGNGAASLHVKGTSKVLHYTDTAKTAVSTLGPVTLDSTALSIAAQSMHRLLM